MSSEQYPDLIERLRRADPTKSAPFRLVDFVFKMFQWLAFSAFAQAVGKKLQEPRLTTIGSVLFVLVLLYMSFAFLQVEEAILDPFGKDSFKKKVIFWTFSLAVSIVFNVFISFVLTSAAERLIDFYVGKSP